MLTVVTAFRTTVEDLSRTTEHSNCFVCFNVADILQCSCFAIQQFAAQTPNYLLMLLRCARACDCQSVSPHYVQTFGN